MVDRDWDEVKPEEHKADESDITPDTRAAVLKRDRWRCRRCGEEDLAALTLHHVKYRSHGGGHDDDNLVTLCWPCHSLIHKKLVTVLRIGIHWFFSDTRHWRNQRT